MQGYDGMWKKKRKIPREENYSSSEDLLSPDEFDERDFEEDKEEIDSSFANHRPCEEGVVARDSSRSRARRSEALDSVPKGLLRSLHNIDWSPLAQRITIAFQAVLLHVFTLQCSLNYNTTIIATRLSPTTTNSTEVDLYPSPQKNFFLTLFYLSYLSYLSLSCFQLRFDPKSPSALATSNSLASHPITFSSYLIFLLYRFTPFLNECRVLCDFVASDTSLNIYMWFLLDDAAANLYFTKADMEYRKEHKPFYRPRPSFEKFSNGVCGLVLIFLLLLGPLAYYSTLNIFFTFPNLVSGGMLQLDLEVKMRRGVTRRVRLFESAQGDVEKCGDEVSDNIEGDMKAGFLDLEKPASTCRSRFQDKFPLRDIRQTDIQFISFPTISDSLWITTPGLKAALFELLTLARDAPGGADSVLEHVRFSLAYTFYRSHETVAPIASPAAEGRVLRDLTFSDENSKDKQIFLTLIEMLRPDSHPFIFNQREAAVENIQPSTSLRNDEFSDDFEDSGSSDSETPKTLFPTSSSPIILKSLYRPYIALSRTPVIQPLVPHVSSDLQSEESVTLCLHQVEQPASTFWSLRRGFHPACQNHFSQDKTDADSVVRFQAASEKLQWSGETESVSSSTAPPESSGFTLIGIYTLAFLTVGRTLKSLFDYSSQRVIYTELEDTSFFDAIISGVYVAQENQDLETEWTLYMQLVRLYRSPEMLLEYSKDLQVGSEDKTTSREKRRSTSFGVGRASRAAIAFGYGGDGNRASMRGPKRRRPTGTSVDPQN